jgi:hypothetical protein
VRGNCDYCESLIENEYLYGYNIVPTDKHVRSLVIGFGVRPSALKCESEICKKLVVSLPG